MYGYVCAFVVQLVGTCLQLVHHSSMASSELLNALQWPSNGQPLIVIRDSVTTSADFITVNFMATTLLPSSGSNIPSIGVVPILAPTTITSSSAGSRLCLVGVQNSFQHYVQLTRKLVAPHIRLLEYFGLLCC
jgi:hypothetical protein